MSDSTSRLHGFVNVAKLEDVIQSLLQRMDAQQSRIDALERQAAQSVPLTQFTILSQRLDRTIDHLNTQFGALDQRLTEMTDELAGIQAHLATLPALRQQVDGKIDASLAQQRNDDLRTNFTEQLHHLRADKASKAVVSALEDSQHRLVEETLALQKLLACKIDRVEVPLLNVASEKLQFLLDFQATADTRLEKAEADLVNLNKTVALKESKQSFGKTIQLVRDELARKVDLTFVKERLLEPLTRTEDEVARLRASEEVLQKLLHDHHAHAERAAHVDKVLGDVEKTTLRVTRDFAGIREELARKADYAAIDRVVFENADEVERIAREYDSRAEHASKVQAAYLSDVRTQLEDMHRYQNTIDAKLQTALRFIDWFMDVKQQGNGRP